MIVGTPSYAAPEIIMHKQYGPPSDCWAAGVVLYILLSGRGATPPPPLSARPRWALRYECGAVSGGCVSNGCCAGCTRSTRTATGTASSAAS